LLYCGGSAAAALLPWGPAQVRGEVPKLKKKKKKKLFQRYCEGRFQEAVSTPLQCLNRPERSFQTLFFTGFSAVFVYKPHVLTAAVRGGVPKTCFFTGFSAVFVYKPHVLTAAVRGGVPKTWFSLDSRLFSSINRMFSPQLYVEEFPKRGFSLDSRLFSSINRMFSPQPGGGGP
jgi:hypothetical protein